MPSFQPVGVMFLIKAILSTFDQSCGPVVEQGTHFCDLSRYFGGDVDISTVTAHSLEWYENPGHLRKQTIDETQIPPENRIPRVTSATWKYESGAVGNFIHLVALQGHDYSCEFEVYADGYQFKYASFCFVLSLVLRLCSTQQACQPVRATNVAHSTPRLGPGTGIPLPGR
jgi:predicted dehydrogenase